MKLRLSVSDARKVVADVQFVKHFDGLLGGSERVLDGASNGAIEKAIIFLESSRFRNSQLIEIGNSDRIGCKNLLVLSLGDIRRFNITALSEAMGHAMVESLKRGFKSIATPVIGISESVGLPLPRAYTQVLESLLLMKILISKDSNKSTSVEELIIFDNDEKKVEFFAAMTDSILTTIKLEHRKVSFFEYEINIETPSRNKAIEQTEKPKPKESSAQIIERVVDEDKVSTVKILYLAANPTDTKNLRLDQEIREIDAALNQSKYRDRFDIHSQWALRISDLQTQLLRHQPEIVHFSGHGSQASELILENSQGKSQSVSASTLGQLFSLLKDRIRCVVLNACYSEVQAKAIAQHIDCVVGMKSGIGDQAAISFAKAFYQALGYGRDLNKAFELGRLQIDLDNLDYSHVPKLIADRIDPKTFVLVK